jgi:hypothetical protein
LSAPEADAARNCSPEEQFSKGVLWIDPARIQFKISPIIDLGPIEGGDWDIDRRYPLTENIKHRAIEQRYADGRRWEDTDLFRDIYTRRFAGGGMVRGESTMTGLLAQYYSRVDALYASLCRHGFQTTDRTGRRYPLPNLLIGRDCDVYLGNNGNHRFAMARLLGLRIAGEIVCRHLSTQ